MSKATQVLNVLTNLMSSGFIITLSDEQFHYVIEVELEGSYAEDYIAKNNFSGGVLSDVLNQLAKTVVERKND